VPTDQSGPPPGRNMRSVDTTRYVFPVSLNHRRVTPSLSTMPSGTASSQRKTATERFATPRVGPARRYPRRNLTAAGAHYRRPTAVRWAVCPIAPQTVPKFVSPGIPLVGWRIFAHMVRSMHPLFRFSGSGPHWEG
jgi:hypothetical protein